MGLGPGTTVSFGPEEHTPRISASPPHSEFQTMRETADLSSSCRQISFQKPKNFVAPLPPENELNVLKKLVTAQMWLDVPQKLATPQMFDVSRPQSFLLDTNFLRKKKKLAWNSDVPELATWTRATRG